MGSHIFIHPSPFLIRGSCLGDRWFTNLDDTKQASSAHDEVSRIVCVINTYLDCNVSRKFISSQSHTNMKYLIPLLAFSFLIGCDGEKSNEPKEPNLKYETEGDAVTITDSNKKASGDLIIPTFIEDIPVTSIGEEAFRFCTSLTSITIPDLSLIHI